MNHLAFSPSHALWIVLVPNPHHFSEEVQDCVPPLRDDDDVLLSMRMMRNDLSTPIHYRNVVNDAVVVYGNVDVVDKTLPLYHGDYSNHMDSRDDAVVVPADHHQCTDAHLHRRMPQKAVRTIAVDAVVEIGRAHV